MGMNGSGELVQPPFLADYTFNAHRNCVHSVEWSHDANFLATASEDRNVCIWTKDGTLHKRLPHLHVVRCAVFCPDGERLASCADDRSVLVWGWKTNTLLRDMRGHTLSIRAVAWSADASLLASCSDDGSCIVWNPSSGSTLRRLCGHASFVLAIAWSPHGNMLASAGAYGDNSVVVWDTRSSSKARTLRGHSDQVRTVAFSPSGDVLASGSNDSSVLLWDWSRGMVTHRLKGHSGRDGCSCEVSDLGVIGGVKPDCCVSGHRSFVYSVAWSADEIRLATASRDGTIIVWSKRGTIGRDGAVEGTALRTLPRQPSAVTSMAWAPRGLLATAASAGTVTVWRQMDAAVFAAKEELGSIDAAERRRREELEARRTAAEREAERKSKAIDEAFAAADEELAAFQESRLRRANALVTRNN